MPCTSLAFPQVSSSCLLLTENWDVCTPVSKDYRSQGGESMCLWVLVVAKDFFLKKNNNDDH